MSLQPLPIPDSDNVYRRADNKWRVKSKKHKKNPNHIPTVAFKDIHYPWSVFWDNPPGIRFTIEDAKKECLRSNVNPSTYGILILSVEKIRAEHLLVTNDPKCDGDDSKPSRTHTIIETYPKGQGEDHLISLTAAINALLEIASWSTPFPKED